MKAKTKKFDSEKELRELQAWAKERNGKCSSLLVESVDVALVQMRYLRELDKSTQEEGTMVTKEYVKGRANLYVNPAIAAYNQTSNAMDKTMQTILKCIAALEAEASETGDEFDDF